MIINAPESLDFFEPVATPLLFNGYHPKGYLLPKDYLTKNITRQHPLWQELIGRVEAKRQNRILVPELDDEIITPSTCADINLAYLATGGSKTIYVRNKGSLDCKYMPVSSGGITSSELAREYIRMCLESAGKTLRSPKRYYQYLDIPASLYYEGGKHTGRYAYVDISSAYWTIHKTTTIDMRFTPDKVVGTGKAEYLNTDEITNYRGLRHAIPGSLRAGKMQLCRNGKPEAIEFKGDLSYPGVIGYTMSVMHSIAREVIDHFGALMILTDAYIVPQEYGATLVQFLRERWGVTAVIKAQGDSSLYELNCYQVGNHRSADADPEGTYRSKSFSNLIDIDSSWMCKERRILLNRGLGCDTY